MLVPNIHETASQMASASAADVHDEDDDDDDDAAVDDSSLYSSAPYTFQTFIL